MFAEFLTIAREKYAAEVVSLPFQSPEAARRINAWVAEKSRGKIGSIDYAVNSSAFLLLSTQSISRVCRKNLKNLSPAKKASSVPGITKSKFR